MMNAAVEGVILGLTLSFLFGFGPAFFALVQTGIHRGFWAGFLLAVGIILNDLLIVVLTLLGATKAMVNLETYHVFGMVGGGILIIFGIITYKRKPAMDAYSEEKSERKPHFIEYIGKGFLLNILNPFVWIFWLGIVVGLTARFQADTTSLVTFFGTALSIVFVTDIFKTFAASRFRELINRKFLVLINKIAGIGLIVFGVFLIIKSIIEA
jgi:threonine/homoserine/homoserine lactone efflux protein